MDSMAVPLGVSSGVIQSEMTHFCTTLHKRKALFYIASRHYAKLLKRHYSDSDSEGHRFESCQAYIENPGSLFPGFFLFHRDSAIRVHRSFSVRHALQESFRF